MEPRRGENQTPQSSSRWLQVLSLDQFIYSVHFYWASIVCSVLGTGDMVGNQRLHFFSRELAFKWVYRQQLIVLYTMSSETQWLSSQLASYSGWVDTGAGLINPEKTSSLEKILTLWDSGFGGNKKKGRWTYDSSHIQRQQSRMEWGQIIKNRWNKVSAWADGILMPFLRPPPLFYNPSE